MACTRDMKFCTSSFYNFRNKNAAPIFLYFYIEINLKSEFLPTTCLSWANFHPSNVRAYIDRTNK